MLSLPFNNKSMDCFTPVSAWYTGHAQCVTGTVVAVMLWALNCGLPCKAWLTKRCNRACVGRNRLNIRGVLPGVNLHDRLDLAYCRVYFGFLTLVSICTFSTLGAGTVVSVLGAMCNSEVSCCATVGTCGRGSVGGSGMAVGSTLGAAAATGICVGLRNI